MFGRCSVVSKMVSEHDRRACSKTRVCTRGNIKAKKKRESKRNEHWLLKKSKANCVPIISSYPQIKFILKFYQQQFLVISKFSPLSDYVIPYITTRMIFSFSANKILVQNFWHLKSLVLNSVKSMKLKS